MTVEKEKKYNPRCFLDAEVGGQPLGRIVFELFSDVCPITCENFRALCTGEKGVGKTTGKPLHYKNTVFHRVVKGFMVQGGDFSACNGSGGESIYGGTFPDENFTLKHDSPFCLSMANRGKDTNGSQFFITTLPAPHLDGVHVVFGHVISGQEVVTELENQLTDQSSRPFTDIRIFNSGELVLKSKSKSKHRKSDKSSSPLEEGEMSDDKSKHKKKHKKHSKKNKKEKHRKNEDVENAQNDVARPKREADFDCSVRADEIPDIPTNNFLMRRGPPETEEPRRPPYRNEGYIRRTKISKSGRKIKGRGHMRYRTPSPEGSRSGSETPPHWRQAQSRVRSLKEALEEKRRLLEELEAQQSQEEEDEEEPPEIVPKPPTEEFPERFSRRHREASSKDLNDFPRREDPEGLPDHRNREGRSSRHHSERPVANVKGYVRERPVTRREEVPEGRGTSRDSGRRRDRRSHRKREESDEEYDSSTSPVRKGMQSTVISKVVYQNKPSEILTGPAKPTRKFTEEKPTKSKHDEKEKKSRNSTSSHKSPSGSHSKQNVEEGERNGVSGHRHHHHHHRHKSEKPKETSVPVLEDAHAELGQSPMASLEVDKDTSIVDMDCTPIIHPANEEETPVVVAIEKHTALEEAPPDTFAATVPEKHELYPEPEMKSSDLSHIRIPGLGSDDDSDSSVEEEPPPPPGTEDIVLFKNYLPPVLPIPSVAEREEEDVKEDASAPGPNQKEEFIPALPPPEKAPAPVVVVSSPPRPTVQKLPFLDDDSDEEERAAPAPVALPAPAPAPSSPASPPSPPATASVPALIHSPQKPESSPSHKIMESSATTTTTTTTTTEVTSEPVLEKKKDTKERRSPSPKKHDAKEGEKPRGSTTKPAESSRNSRADRSSSRSRTAKRHSRSRSSRSPRRGSSATRRRSLSRGRRRPSPPYRNRSPIWRRSSDYRRPLESGRRRRSPSLDRRRSRSRSKNRSRPTPPRYTRRRSRSASRGHRGKRSRSSSSSSSSSSNSSSRRRSKRGRKTSRSSSSSSSSSNSSSSSSSS